MILLLLHRRGARTFGQTERETGMKQRLLTQVRIELVLSERVEYEYEGRGKGEKNIKKYKKQTKQREQNRGVIRNSEEL